MPNELKEKLAYVLGTLVAAASAYFVYLQWQSNRDQRFVEYVSGFDRRLADIEYAEWDRILISDLNNHFEEGVLLMDRGEISRRPWEDYVTEMCGYIKSSICGQPEMVHYPNLIFGNGSAILDVCFPMMDAIECE